MDVLDPFLGYVTTPQYLQDDRKESENNDVKAAPTQEKKAFIDEIVDKLGQEKNDLRKFLNYLPQLKDNTDKTVKYTTHNEASLFLYNNQFYFFQKSGKKVDEFLKSNTKDEDAIIIDSNASIDDLIDKLTAKEKNPETARNELKKIWLASFQAVLENRFSSFGKNFKNNEKPSSKDIQEARFLLHQAKVFENQLANAQRQLPPEDIQSLEQLDLNFPQDIDLERIAMMPLEGDLDLNDNSIEVKPLGLDKTPEILSPMPQPIGLAEKWVTYARRACTCNSKGKKMCLNEGPFTYPSNNKTREDFPSATECVARYYNEEFLLGNEDAQASERKELQELISQYFTSKELKTLVNLGEKNFKNPFSDEKKDDKLKLDADEILAFLPQLSRALKNLYSNGSISQEEFVIYSSELQIVAYNTKKYGKKEEPPPPSPSLKNFSDTFGNKNKTFFDLNDSLALQIQAINSFQKEHPKEKAISENFTTKKELSPSGKPVEDLKKALENKDINNLLKKLVPTSWEKDLPENLTSIGAADLIYFLAIGGELKINPSGPITSKEDETLLEIAKICGDIQECNSQLPKGTFEEIFEKKSIDGKQRIQLKKNLNSVAGQQRATRLEGGKLHEMVATSYLTELEKMFPQLEKADPEDPENSATKEFNLLLARLTERSNDGVLFLDEDMKNRPEVILSYLHEILNRGIKQFTKPDGMVDSTAIMNLFHVSHLIVSSYLRVQENSQVNKSAKNEEANKVLNQIQKQRANVLNPFLNERQAKPEPDKFVENRKDWHPELATKECVERFEKLGVKGQSHLYFAQMELMGENLDREVSDFKGASSSAYEAAPEGFSRTDPSVKGENGEIYTNLSSELLNNLDNILNPKEEIQSNENEIEYKKLEDLIYEGIKSNNKGAFQKIINSIISKNSSKVCEIKTVLPSYDCPKELEKFKNSSLDIRPLIPLIIGKEIDIAIKNKLIDENDKTAFNDGNKDAVNKVKMAILSQFEERQSLDKINTPLSKIRSEIYHLYLSKFFVGNMNPDKLPPSMRASAQSEIEERYVELNNKNFFNNAAGSVPLEAAISSIGLKFKDDLDGPPPLRWNNLSSASGSKINAKNQGNTLLGACYNNANFNVLSGEEEYGFGVDAATGLFYRQNQKLKVDADVVSDQEGKRLFGSDPKRMIITGPIREFKNKTYGWVKINTSTNPPVYSVSRMRGEKTATFEGIDFDANVKGTLLDKNFAANKNFTFLPQTNASIKSLLNAFPDSIQEGTYDIWAENPKDGNEPNTIFFCEKGSLKPIFVAKKDNQNFSLHRCNKELNGENALESLPRVLSNVEVSENKFKPLVRKMINFAGDEKKFITQVDNITKKINNFTFPNLKHNGKILQFNLSEKGDGFFLEDDPKWKLSEKGIPRPGNEEQYLDPLTAYPGAILLENTTKAGAYEILLSTEKFLTDFGLGDVKNEDFPTIQLSYHMRDGQRWSDSIFSSRPEGYLALALIALQNNDEAIAAEMVKKVAAHPRNLSPLALRILDGIAEKTAGVREKITKSKPEDLSKFSNSDLQLFSLATRCNIIRYKNNEAPKIEEAESLVSELKILSSLALPQKDKTLLTLKVLSGVKNQQDAILIEYKPLVGRQFLPDHGELESAVQKIREDIVTTEVSIDENVKSILGNVELARTFESELEKIFEIKTNNAQDREENAKKKVTNSLRDMWEKEKKLFGTEETTKNVTDFIIEHRKSAAEKRKSIELNLNKERQLGKISLENAIAATMLVQQRDGMIHFGKMHRFLYELNPALEAQERDDIYSDLLEYQKEVGMMRYGEALLQACKNEGKNPNNIDLKAHPELTLPSSNEDFFEKEYETKDFNTASALLFANFMAEINPRTEQVEKFLEIAHKDAPGGMIVAPMGGGKTKMIIPITVLRNASEGRLTVVEVLESQYAGAGPDLRAALADTGKKLIDVKEELDIHDAESLANFTSNIALLKKLDQLLSSAAQDLDSAVLITNDVANRLLLAAENLAAAPDRISGAEASQQFRLLCRILKTCKKASLVVDEAHKVFDPKEALIIATQTSGGDNRSIDSRYCHLASNLFHILSLKKKDQVPSEEDWIGKTIDDGNGQKSDARKFKESLNDQLGQCYENIADPKKIAELAQKLDFQANAQSANWQKRTKDDMMLLAKMMALEILKKSAENLPALGLTYDEKNNTKLEAKAIENAVDVLSNWILKDTKLENGMAVIEQEQNEAMKEKIATLEEQMASPSPVNEEICFAKGMLQDGLRWIATRTYGNDYGAGPDGTTIFKIYHEGVATKATPSDTMNLLMGYYASVANRGIPQKVFEEVVESFLDAHAANPERNVNINDSVVGKNFAKLFAGVTYKGKQMQISDCYIDKNLAPEEQEKKRNEVYAAFAKAVQDQPEIGFRIADRQVGLQLSCQPSAREIRPGSVAKLFNSAEGFTGTPIDFGAMPPALAPTPAEKAKPEPTPAHINAILGKLQEKNSETPVEIIQNYNIQTTLQKIQDDDLKNLTSVLDLAGMYYDSAQNEEYTGGEALAQNIQDYYKEKNLEIPNIIFEAPGGARYVLKSDRTKVKIEGSGTASYESVGITGQHNIVLHSRPMGTGTDYPHPKNALGIMLVNPNDNGLNEATQAIMRFRGYNNDGDWNQRYKIFVHENYKSAVLDENNKPSIKKVVDCWQKKEKQISYQGIQQAIMGELEHIPADVAIAQLVDKFGEKKSEELTPVVALLEKLKPFLEINQQFDPIRAYKDSKNKKDFAEFVQNKCNNKMDSLAGALAPIFIDKTVQPQGAHFIGENECLEIRLENDTKITINANDLKEEQLLAFNILKECQKKINALNERVSRIDQVHAQEKDNLKFAVGANDDVNSDVEVEVDTTTEKEKDSEMESEEEREFGIYKKIVADKPTERNMPPIPNEAKSFSEFIRQANLATEPKASFFQAPVQTTDPNDPEKTILENKTVVAMSFGDAMRKAVSFIKFPENSEKTKTTYSFYSDIFPKSSPDDPLDCDLLVSYDFMNTHESPLPIFHPEHEQVNYAIVYRDGSRSRTMIISEREAEQYRIAIEKGKLTGCQIINANGLISNRKPENESEIPNDSPEIEEARCYMNLMQGHVQNLLQLPKAYCNIVEKTGGDVAYVKRMGKVFLQQLNNPDEKKKNSQLMENNGVLSTGFYISAEQQAKYIRDHEELAKDFDEFFSPTSSERPTRPLANIGCKILKNEAINDKELSVGMARMLLVSVFNEEREDSLDQSIKDIGKNKDCVYKRVLDSLKSVRVLPESAKKMVQRLAYEGQNFSQDNLKQVDGEKEKKLDQLQELKNFPIKGSVTKDKDKITASHALALLNLSDAVLNFVPYSDDQYKEIVKMAFSENFADMVGETAEEKDLVRKLQTERIKAIGTMPADGDKLTAAQEKLFQAAIASKQPLVFRHINFQQVFQNDVLEKSKSAAEEQILQALEEQPSLGAEPEMKENFESLWNRQKIKENLIKAFQVADCPNAKNLRQVLIERKDQFKLANFFCEPGCIEQFKILRDTPETKSIFLSVVEAVAKESSKIDNIEAPVIDEFFNDLVPFLNFEQINKYISEFIESHTNTEKGITKKSAIDSLIQLLSGDLAKLLETKSNGLDISLLDQKNAYLNTLGVFAYFNPASISDSQLVKIFNIFELDNDILKNEESQLRTDVLDIFSGLALAAEQETDLAKKDEEKTINKKSFYEKLKEKLTKKSDDNPSRAAKIEKETNGCLLIPLLTAPDLTNGAKARAIGTAITESHFSNQYGSEVSTCIQDENFYKDSDDDKKVDFEIKLTIGPEGDLFEVPCIKTSYREAEQVKAAALIYIYSKNKDQSAEKNKFPKELAHWNALAKEILNENNSENSELGEISLNTKKNTFLSIKDPNLEVLKNVENWLTDSEKNEGLINENLPLLWLCYKNNLLNDESKTNFEALAQNGFKGISPETVNNMAEDFDIKNTDVFINNIKNLINSGIEEKINQIKPKTLALFYSLINNKIEDKKEEWTKNDKVLENLISNKIKTSYFETQKIDNEKDPINGAKVALLFATFGNGAQINALNENWNENGKITNSIVDGIIANQKIEKEDNSSDFINGFAGKPKSDRGAYARNTNVNNMAIIFNKNNEETTAKLEEAINGFCKISQEGESVKLRSYQSFFDALPSKFVDFYKDEIENENNEEKGKNLYALWEGRYASLYPQDSDDLSPFGKFIRSFIRSKKSETVIIHNSSEKPPEDNDENVINQKEDPITITNLSFGSDDNSDNTESNINESINDNNNNNSVKFGDNEDINGDNDNMGDGNNSNVGDDNNGNVEDGNIEDDNNGNVGDGNNDNIEDGNNDNIVGKDPIFTTETVPFSLKPKQKTNKEENNSNETNNKTVKENKKGEQSSTKKEEVVRNKNNEIIIGDKDFSQYEKNNVNKKHKQNGAGEKPEEKKNKENPEQNQKNFQNNKVSKAYKDSGIQTEKEENERKVEPISTKKDVGEVEKSNQSEKTKNTTKKSNATSAKNIDHYRTAELTPMTNHKTIIYTIFMATGFIGGAITALLGFFGVAIALGVMGVIATIPYFYSTSADEVTLAELDQRIKDRKKDADRNDPVESENIQSEDENSEEDEDENSNESTDHDFLEKLEKEEQRRTNLMRNQEESSRTQGLAKQETPPGDKN